MRREFQRERQTVEPAAYVDHRFDIGGIEREAPIGRLCAIDEQRYRPESQRLFDIDLIVGERQRAKPIDPFVGDLQGRLARDQQLQTRGGSEQMRRDARHLVEQMFGVVEQDQDLQRCDRARQRCGRVADGGRHAEGRRDGVRDLSRIAHRRQVDETDAVQRRPYAPAARSAPAASCRCHRRRRS